MHMKNREEGQGQKGRCRISRTSWMNADFKIWDLWGDSLIGIGDIGGDIQLGSTGPSSGHGKLVGKIPIYESITLRM